jgi:hypothetical protein
LLVPFDKSYTEEKGNIDHNLKDKLREERSGIFNIFLELFDCVSVVKREVKIDSVDFVQFLHVVVQSLWVVLVEVFEHFVVQLEVGSLAA